VQNAAKEVWVWFTRAFEQDLEGVVLVKGLLEVLLVLEGFCLQIPEPEVIRI
jgi:hypothetical protein